MEDDRGYDRYWEALQLDPRAYDLTYMDEDGHLPHGVEEDEDGPWFM